MHRVAAAWGTGVTSRFELPDVRTPPAITGGRSIREGYQRGWSLQFGKVAEQVEADPLFHAAQEAGAWSLVSREKRLNLYLLLTCFLDKLSSQNIVEFGSFRGGNALFMAAVLKELYPAAKVYALDTYAGMPETDIDRDLHRAGDFATASLPELMDRASQFGLDNLIPVKGLFADTFPKLSGVSFGLAHIDCDIYPAVKYSQDAVWPQMAKGGYLVYDDADVSSCIGATEAVEDLIIERRIHMEQVWPHWVVRAL